MVNSALFPIALLAYVGISTRYINVVFTPTTRWLFLVILAVAVFSFRRSWGVLQRSAGIPVLMYCIWCLTTFTWSIVPNLSLAKAVASLATVIVFLTGGYYWAGRATKYSVLLYLAPVAGIAVGSGITGQSTYASAERVLYVGLTGNPNFLGMVAASSAPLFLFFLYKVFKRPTSGIWRAAAIASVGLVGMLLWRSESRAGLLCAACVVLVAIAALRPSKIVAIVLVSVNLAVLVGVIVPEVQDKLYERFIIKYNDSDGDIFYTRRDAWAQSEEGARQGGLIGLGYGVSYGDTDFQGGFTANTYGREKGNSQLAIIEEVGWVGLGFYALVLFALLSDVIGAFWRLPTGDLKMELGLTLGLMTGLLVQSCFEAWWTAPGSAESGIFWATSGVALGLARRAELARNPALAGRVAPVTTLQPALPYNG